MYRTIVMASVIAATLCGSAMARIIHVPADYSTIQTGINSSANGDTVLVARGIYNEFINFNGHLITLTSNYLFSQDTSDIMATRIRPVGYWEDTLVTFNHNETSAAQLYGFHLEYGTPGVCVVNASPKIMYNYIEWCSTGLSNGAGIHWHGGQMTIVGNTLFYNMSEKGGGIWADSCTGNIHHNLIIGNLAGIGTGIFLYKTGQVSIYNNTIARNYNAYPSDLTYGVVYFDSTTTSCLVYNNIMAFNPSGLGQIGPLSMGHSYNDLFSNSEGNYYNCNQSTGEILVNPSFLNPDSAGIHFDYRIASYSPCVDAGLPSSPHDPDGSRADMGALWPPVEISGFISGTIVDITQGLPVVGAFVSETNTRKEDTSDTNGNFILGPFYAGSSYDVWIRHQGFVDTSFNDVSVSLRDTTILGTIRLRTGLSSFDYISGDVNHDGDATPWADLVYMINYLSGIPNPPHFYNCSPQDSFPAAADVNGSCSFDSLDAIALKSYWAGNQGSLGHCSDCIQPSADSMRTPAGSDPGSRDTIIIGNLNLSSMRAYPGGQLNIPVWVKTDESIPALNISLAVADSFSTQWTDGNMQYPLTEWDECLFWTPEPAQPFPGYSSRSLGGWACLNYLPRPLLNTNGTYQQVAQFSLTINSNPALIGHSTRIFPGLHHLAGPTAFCDSLGRGEWLPVIAGGLLTILGNVPNIELSRTAIIDSINEGFSLNETLYITNLGIADLSYNITGDTTWMAINPDHGIIGDLGCDTIGITFSTAHLIPGTYQDSITVTSNDPDQGSIILPVAIVVKHYPYGGIKGTITNQWARPVMGVRVTVGSWATSDTTDGEGRYFISPIGAGSYTIHFSQPRYADTLVTGFFILPYDTVSLNLTMRALPPAVLHVPGEYPSIQKAIDFALTYGDTVMVAPGTYLENINYLGKDVYLKSSGGPNSTIIEPQASGVPIISLTRHETTGAILEGFTVRNSVDVPAIGIDSAGVTVNGNIFKNNNNNAGQGGAIALKHCPNFKIHHNLFYNNHCGDRGGAIYIDSCGSGGVIYNNTLAFNSTEHPQYAGGIALQFSSSITLYNNIIAQNAGVGLDCSLAGSPQTAIYNDIWGNDVNYAGINPGAGSISLDPLFQNPPSSFGIRIESPCIDTGDPSSPQDPDGTRADMGAFYFDHSADCSYIVGDMNGNGATNGLDIAYGVYYLRGGPAPPIRCDICPQPPPFYAAGDVNASCSFNGIDISYMVVFLRGGPPLHYCPTCPPARR